MGVFKAGPGEPEVVEQMIERLAGDQHAEAAISVKSAVPSRPGS